MKKKRKSPSRGIIINIIIIIIALVCTTMQSLKKFYGKEKHIRIIRGDLTKTVSEKLPLTW